MFLQEDPFDYEWTRTDCLILVPIITLVVWMCGTYLALPIGVFGYEMVAAILNGIFPSLEISYLTTEQQLYIMNRPEEVFEWLDIIVYGSVGYFMFMGILPSALWPKDNNISNNFIGQIATFVICTVIALGTIVYLIMFVSVLIKAFITAFGKIDSWLGI